MPSIRLIPAAVALVLSSGAIAACSTPVLTTCVGEWELSAMTVGGEDVGMEELAQLQSLGLEIHMSIDADGGAELVFLGEAESGQWEGKADGCDLLFSGDIIKAKVEGDTLVMSEDDQEVTFSRQ